mgnify:CR=1 FL=1
MKRFSFILCLFLSLSVLSFGQDWDKPIRRKKKWNYGFYFPEFEDEEEDLEEEYLEEKIDLTNNKKVKKLTQKKK